MKNNNKQKGFSLIELILALAIISVLAVVVYNMGASSSGSIAHSQVKEETKAFFPIAVKNCLSRVRGDLSGCTASKIQTISISPLTSTTTPCGDTWSVTSTAPSIVVVYPLDQCIDNDSFGADLATDLSVFHKISAVYDNSTNDLTITYNR